jgi:hypothetical protein
MLQVAFMVLGIVYVFKLIGLAKAGVQLGLPPEALAAWRHYRFRQYVWGIVAGWGSAVVGVIVLVATIKPGTYYTESEALAAQVPSLLAGIAVLIVGIVFSSRARGRARGIETQSAASTVWAPS